VYVVVETLVIEPTCFSAVGDVPQLTTYFENGRPPAMGLQVQFTTMEVADAPVSEVMTGAGGKGGVVTETIFDAGESSFAESTACTSQ